MREKILKLEQKPLEPLVLRVLSAWCLSSVALMFAAQGDFAELETYAGIPLWGVVLAFGLSLGLLELIIRRKKKRGRDITRSILPVCFGVFSGLTVKAESDYYYLFVLTALWAILIFYYHRRGWLRFKKGALSEKSAKKIILISAAVFFAVVGGIGVLRYVTYRSPNFDFGIFAQMFYNMRAHFAPVTTCERDGLLSHFAVHISPIYYLILPFYAVIPSPVTLQLAQAAILTSAVWPMYRLCRRFSLSPFATAAMCCLLLLYPAVEGGANYDIHENCFLLPLLLWVFCLFEEERYLLMLIPTVLTLLVKEDAAVYIIFFALFVFLDRRQYLRGLGLAAGAAVYFVLALFLLRNFGDGVMEGRYGNFIVNDGGLLEAVKNVLADPGFALTQLLLDEKETYAEKLLFLLQMFVPLSFLPFCLKRISRLLLLLPMVLLNLLTLYPYQYQIDFQYTFGVAAFVLYLSVLNLSELPHGTMKRVLAVSLICGAMCFIANPVNRLTGGGFGVLVTEREQIALIDETVRSIPKDASVIASSYLTPHLSKRDTLYEMYYHKPQKEERVDYILLDLRFKYEKYISKYEKLGYAVTKTVFYEGERLLVVMEPAEKQ